MFKKLVLSLRKSDFETAKCILRNSSIRDLIEADTEWLSPKWACTEDGVEVEVFERDPRDYEMHMECLNTAIYRHVKNPDVIYEILLAGLSPALMARIFINDPYRLSILMRLLPVLAPNLEHEEQLEEINDAGGVESYDDKKSYTTTDLVSHCAPNFPVIYNNYTCDLQLLIDSLFVKNVKIADSTNQARVLENLIENVNRRRSRENKPALNEDTDEGQQELNRLAKSANDLARDAFDREFAKVYFALEVYETMKSIGVTLQSDKSAAIFRALNQYLKNIELDERVFLCVLIYYLLSIFYVLNLDASFILKTPSFALATLQAYAVHKITTVISYEPEAPPKLKYTLYDLYKTESYPYASKSTGMVDSIRARHLANDPADFQTKIDNGLYFWRKVIAPLPQSEAAQNSPVIHDRRMKSKVE